MTAPSSRNKVKLLVRLKLPVSHLPLGTVSWDPPLSPKGCMNLTAFRNAAVFEVFPSPTPPKSLIDFICFLAGKVPKKPAQLLASRRSDESEISETKLIGKKDFVEIWRNRRARKVKRRNRKIHGGLKPMAKPKFGFIDSISNEKVKKTII